MQGGCLYRWRHLELHGHSEFWFCVLGVIQSDPRTSSTTNHIVYWAKGRLHGPWCKEPLIRQNNTTRRFSMFISASLVPSWSLHGHSECFFVLGVIIRSGPGTSSTTNHIVYWALGWLHGPWCKEPLIRQNDTTRRFSLFIGASLAPSRSLHDHFEFRFCVLGVIRSGPGTSSTTDHIVYWALDDFMVHGVKKP